MEKMNKMFFVLCMTVLVVDVFVLLMIVSVLTHMIALFYIFGWATVFLTAGLIIALLVTLYRLNGAVRA